MSKNEELGNQVKIAGWSHIPYALKSNKGHPDAVATEIAKQYIAMFDKALRARGYVVAAAVEIEADIHTGKKSRQIIKESNGLSGYTPTKKIVEAAADQINAINEAAYDNVLSGQGRIERCFKETGDRDIEMTTVPSRPLAMAALVARVKQNLFEGTREGFEQVTGVSLKGIKPKRREDLINKANISSVSKMGLTTLMLDKVRFRGTGSSADQGHELTHAEHINLSVHDVENAENAKINDEMMRSSHLMSNPKFTQGFCRFLMNFGFNDWPLLSSGASSDLRMNIRYKTNPDLPTHEVKYTEKKESELPNKVFGIRPSSESKLSYCRVQGEKPERTRIELRLPDAECNPYLSMLYSMANLYAYIGVYEKDPASAEKGMADLPIESCTAHQFFADRQPQVRQKRFEQQSLVTEMMKNVAVQLNHDGIKEIDTFRQAVIARSNEFEMADQLSDTQKKGR